MHTPFPNRLPYLRRKQKYFSKHFDFGTQVKELEALRKGKK